MKRVSFLIFWILLGLAECTCSRAAENEEVRTIVLSATKFADAYRLVLRRACRITEGDLAAECVEFRKLVDKVSNEDLDKAALPFLARVVSEDDAQKIATFWQSESGRLILDKLFMKMRGQEKGEDQNLLSNEEREMLSKFNESPQGEALRQFQYLTATTEFKAAIQKSQP